MGALQNITDLDVALVFLVFAVGSWAYIAIARRDQRLLIGAGQGLAFRLKSFFLAGGTLGTDLTENNTIGMTFAWANGTWFFSSQAFTYGPNVLWSQIPWCASVIAFALLIPFIIQRVSGRTLHGFLSTRFGVAAQVSAAIATTIGYMFIAGYEASWASFLFVGSLGVPNLRWVFALGLSVLVGAYCAIGGYRSNASVDRPHNILGVVSLAGLPLCLTLTLPVAPELAAAIYVFCAGALIYIAMSLLQASGRLKYPEWVPNGVAAIFGAGAFLVLIYIMRSPPGLNSALPRQLSGVPMPLYLYLGVTSFQLVFNLIDMQNWQQVAANEDLRPRTDRTYRRITFSIVRASMYLFWFPALGGILIGLLLRGVQGADANGLYAIAFSHLPFGSAPLWHGLLLGLLMFGFISTSMSTIDTLLMSAAQTLTYDIFRRRKVESLLQAADRDAAVVVVQEQKITGLVRRYLIPLAVLMTGSFVVVELQFGDDQVVAYQPVMYAIPLVLVPPTLLAIFSKPFGSASVLGWWVTAGILAGITLAVLCVAMTVTSPVNVLLAIGVQAALKTLSSGSSAFSTMDLKNWIPGVLPIITLVASTAGTLVGCARAAAASPRAQAEGFNG